MEAIHEAPIELMSEAELDRLAEELAMALFDVLMDGIDELAAVGAAEPVHL